MYPPAVSLSIPFGKHKGKPLGEVPSGYLLWLVRECKLSSGLRAAVAEELQRRGTEAPPAPPPRALRRCRDHPRAEPVCMWLEDTLGRRRVRADCLICKRAVDYPPCVPPYSDQADANANETPVLDALTRLEELGVSLHSDGRTVWVSDSRTVPADLHAIIRQCRHRLAKMIGKRATMMRLIQGDASAPARTG